MAELDVKQLAAYIQMRYDKEKQKEISPIKLQKSLYFLFAYWGGMVKKSQMYPNAVEEDFSKYSEYLFDEDFEAWVYGPVVRTVYMEHKESNLKSFYKEDLFVGKEKVKEFVDSLLDELFETNDFSLVEISHKDKAWENSFSYDEEFHDNIISKEEIIREYARK